MNAPFKTPAEAHAITSREQWLAMREKDVTASALGALFGVHDYMTAYGLWALKSGKLEVDPDETPAMKRGRLIEPVAKVLIQEQHPDWKLLDQALYYRDPIARIGATPDLLVENADGLGIVQIKNVQASVFRKKWNVEAGDIPTWIAVQAITEAQLVGAQWAAVAAIVVDYGIDLHMVPVPIHAELFDKAKALVADFWRRVAEDDPPPMDFGRDGAIIAELYGNSDGSAVDLSGDPRVVELLGDDEALAVIESDTKKKRATIKAELMAKIGPAEVGIVPGWKLSCKQVNRKGYTVEPSSYRQIRYSRTQEKDNG